MRIVLHGTERITQKNLFRQTGERDFSLVGTGGLEPPTSCV